MPDRTQILLALSGLNQEQAARRVGISPGTLSRYMRGERPLAKQTERRLVEVITEEILGMAARDPPRGG